MKTRVISAVVLITFVVACFAISPLTRALFLLAVIILAVRETCNAIKAKEITCAPAVLYIFSAAAVALIYFSADSIYTEALFFLAIFAVVSAGVMCSHVRGQGALATLAVLVYPTVPMLIITRLALSDYWIPVFALGCITTWVCDSFALFGGKRFGKNKLAPEVSPNKTIEGSVCGAISAVVAGAIICIFIDVPLLCCMITALIASTMGQMGDLAASLIKRWAGIKDYSNLIPGHGGAMDRIDSLLFSIPCTYFCFIIAGVI